MNEPGMVPRRTFLAGAAAVAATAACSSSKPQASSPPPASSPSSPSSATQTAPTGRTFVSAGPRDRQHVALTFHVNGDRALTIRMLDLLKASQVPITAFIVGVWLDANGDLLSRFVDDGHELANHTFTHPAFASLDQTAMTNEVVGCRDALQRLAGTGGTYFRPSGTANGTDSPGSTVLDVARSAGYATVVGYDVDPADYADPGASAIVGRTNDAIRPGSIVSLHFGHAGTIDALPQIFANLETRGLQPVVVSKLLSA